MHTDVRVQRINDLSSLVNISILHFSGWFSYISFNVLISGCFTVKEPIFCSFTLLPILKRRIVRPLKWLIH